jgi:hypothetical protein
MNPSFQSLGSEFDDFLFAPIGEDRNGLLLSVLSALARRDLDPWQEAAELAGLPEAVATQRLASLIAALPDMPSVRHGPGTIAARLVALLPRRMDSANRSQNQPNLATGSEGVRYMIVYALLFALILGLQFIGTGRPSEQTAAPASNAASSETSLSQSHR